MTRRTKRAIAAAVLAALLIPSTAFAYWPVASKASYIAKVFQPTHQAIDIGAPKWTRVIPIRSGRTVFAGWRDNCGGYQVWVSHGNGLYSAYYHLARETSYKGEWVTGGYETIGYVGETGCANGPHLHVEVWRGYPWATGSRRLDPWAYIHSGTYLPDQYR
jgi:murein DD-endopeptidase MepM/ murein hydrolase activator NlpD